MPLVRCPTCERFHKAPDAPQGQGPLGECPGCRAARQASSVANTPAPAVGPAAPRGRRPLIVFGVAALIGTWVFFGMHLLPRFDADGRPTVWARVFGGGSLWFGPSALMAAAAVTLGFVEPRRPWRWGFALVSVPTLYLLATGPFERDPPGEETMHMWPLVVAWLVVCGAAYGLLAYLGAWLRSLPKYLRRG